MLMVRLNVYLYRFSDRKFIDGIKNLVYDAIADMMRVEINSTPFNDIGIAMSFVLCTCVKSSDVEQIYRRSLRRFQWVMERLNKYGLRCMRRQIVIEHDECEEKIAEELARRMSFLDTDVVLAKK